MIALWIIKKVDKMLNKTTIWIIGIIGIIRIIRMNKSKLIIWRITISKYQQVKYHQVVMKVKHKLLYIQNSL
jgi:hypothetical protein